jgi:hypothetical protein
MMQEAPADPLMRFSKLIERQNFPKRSAYGWKDAGLFPYYQINNVIMVREGEVLAALEKFKRIGKQPGPKRPHPISPGRPPKRKFS